jgi:hypothetical protein
MSKASEWLKARRKAESDSVNLWSKRPQWRDQVVSINSQGNCEFAHDFGPLKPKEAVSLGKWLIEVFGDEEPQ